MNLSGGIEIAASPRAVWDFVLDPARLSSCVPGITSVHQVDDRTFEGEIRAAVGPMHGDFAFTSVIRRDSFPTDLLVEISGADSVTHSRVEMTVAASVAEQQATRSADATTRLDYALTVNVKGRLAILGEMMLRATAGAMIGQVSACLRARLEAAASLDGAMAES